MIETARHYSCPRCGGSLIGDGYSLVIHCENAEDDRVWEAEPDAPVIYCESEE